MHDRESNRHIVQRNMSDTMRVFVVDIYSLITQTLTLTLYGIL